jgi:hypothetical protein
MEVWFAVRSPRSKTKHVWKKTVFIGPGGRPVHHQFQAARFSFSALIEFELSRESMDERFVVFSRDEEKQWELFGKQFLNGRHPGEKLLAGILTQVFAEQPPQPFEVLRLAVKSPKINPHTSRVHTRLAIALGWSARGF